MLGIEADILLYIQEHVRNPICDPIFTAITHLGDAGICWIILSIILLCFKKTRKAGLYSAIALIGSLVINNLILKNLFNRTRPYEVIDGLKCMVAAAHDASFPSGHTGSSFASAIAIYPNVPKKYGIALIILASLIAFSRVYIGIHFPTDIIGGIITGVGIGMVVNVIGNRIIKNRKAKAETK